MKAQADRTRADVLGRFAKRKIDKCYDIWVAQKPDLIEIASLDQTEFGFHSVDVDGLTAWWNRYKFGAFVLWYESEGRPERIAGAFGIWPVTRATFQQLLSGQLDETDLNGSNICGLEKDERFKYWYVADVIVEEQLRPSKKGVISNAVATLVTGSLRLWLRNDHIDDKVEFCAIQVGDDIERLLKYFEFERVKSPEGDEIRAKNGDYIYKLSASRSDIENKFAQKVIGLKRQVRWREMAPVLFRLACVAVALGITVTLYYFGLGKSIVTQLVVVLILVGCCFIAKNKEWRSAILAALLATVAILLSQLFPLVEEVFRGLPAK